MGGEEDKGRKEGKKDSFIEYWTKDKEMEQLINKVESGQVS